MRIVIEHDTVNTTSTSSSAAPLVETEAQNGGRALNPVGASDQPAAENAGGPPQWLLDAVKQAMEKDSAAGVTTDALDGGAAST